MSSRFFVCLYMKLGFAGTKLVNCDLQVQIYEIQILTDILVKIGFASW